MKANLKTELIKILAIVEKEPELTKILEIIENEPELPGEMPDEVFKTIIKDKKGLADFARTTVRLTKKNIKDNILKYTKTLQ